MRAVFLWMPNSQAIALSQCPLSPASCTFSHRAFRRAVGILCCSPLDLRGLRSPRSPSLISDFASFGLNRSPALLIPQASPEFSGGWRRFSSAGPNVGEDLPGVDVALGS